MTRRRTAAGALAVIGFVTVTACGGSRPPSGVVVRVGGSAITAHTIQHWISVAAAGSPPSSNTARYRAMRQRAASFLISSAWLLSEAKDRGVEVSDAEIDHALAQKDAALFPGGSTERAQFLRSTDEAIADMRLEVKTRLVASKLRQSVVDSVPLSIPAQVADYYRDHRKQFAIPERRNVLITNRKTTAKALAVRREVSSGRSFTTLAHIETFSPARGAIASAQGRILERAITAAKLDVLTGPVKANVDYFVFEVVDIFPARQQTLAQAKETIAAKLNSDRRRRALTSFDAVWTQKWTGQTDCQPGYIVPECRQYHGSTDREPLPSP
ncbi:MAG: peptidyl-prolyl cis-trans isomerase [Phenylobacterium sp.]|nr:MAG: peptidyl-prolyl cis-trans isomerase [Phenylobacterium sp.]